MARVDDEIRASDAERDATVTRLRDAAAEGRLTFEELADRVEGAATATTRGELAQLTRDLPAPAAPLAPGATTGSDVLVAPVNRSTVFGDTREEGTWLVPAEGKWSSVFGDIVLDLREATVTAEEVHLDAGTVFGDVDVLVPEGVVVEVRAKVLFGDVKQETARSAPAGAPRIVLTGGTMFGDVRVRARRLREKLRDRFLGGPPQPPAPPRPPALP